MAICRRTTAMVIAVLVVHSSHPAAAAPEACIEPQLSQATLEVDGQTLQPTWTASPWGAFHWVGDKRVRLEKGRVTAWKGKESEPLWTTQWPDNIFLTWMTDDGATAYLQPHQTTAQGGAGDVSKPARIHRLDLATGKWLKDLPVVANAPNHLEPQTVISAGG